MKKLLLFAIPLLLTGCCFNSGVPKTEYFNISTPKSSSLYDYNIKFGSFSIASLYDTKMVFTKNSYSIYFDNFNRWAQAPNKMLATYLEIYFNNPNSSRINEKAAPIQINADIIKFDCNLTSHKAVLYVRISLINSLDNSVIFNNIYNEQLPIKDITAYSYAESMAEAFQTVAVKVEKQLNSIYKIND